MPYAKDRNSRIKAANEIIGDGSHAVMKPIKVRSGPDFYDIEEAEKREDQEEIFKGEAAIYKAPGNEHSYYFIYNYPLRIMKAVLDLNFLSENYGKDIKSDD